MNQLDYWPWFTKVMKFYGLAAEIAKLSKDRSTKVGALALGQDFEVLGLGYNGFPRGVNDDNDARHERPTKYKYTSHAEENLVATCARLGISLKGASVIVTALHPCTTCSRLMIQAGVANIFAPASFNERWVEEGEIAAEMLREAGVAIHYYQDRNQEVQK